MLANGKYCNSIATTAPSPLSHYFNAPPMLGLNEDATPTYPQPVLRSSCDACTAAKVRCDKQRPECARCRSLLRQCTYSLSRKHGRSQLKRLNEIHENQDTIADALDLSLGLNEVQQKAFLLWTQKHRRNSRAAEAPGGMMPQIPPDIAASSTATALDHFRFETASSTNSETSLPAFACGEKEYQMYEVANYESEAGPSSDFACEENPERIWNDDSGSGGSSYSGVSSDEDCCFIAVEVLTGLRTLWRLQTPTLDRVLAATKAARQSVSRLLLCPCATAQPTLFMLYYSTVFYILECIKRATSLKSPIRCIHSPGGNAAADGAASISHTATSATFLDRTPSLSFNDTSANEPPKGLLTSVQAIIGDHDLDDEGREALGRQLLLCELRKVTALVDEIALKHFESDCKSSKTDTGWAVREAHLADTLRKNLDKSARDIASKIDTSIR